MITDADLDLVLADWLSIGGDRAPRADVAAALDRVARTRQRRRSRWSGVEASRVDLRPWIAAAMLVLAIIAATIIGTGAIKLTSDSVPVEPRPAPATVLRPVRIDDWAVTLSVPQSWTQVEYQCCDYGQFKGESPEGSVSVGNGAAYSSAVCDPECHRFELPIPIPLSAAKQLDALKAEVAKIAGADAWTAVPPGVLPEIDGGKARLEATHIGPDGREWRTVYVVGVLKRNVVTFSWSQPADVFDQDQLDEVLAGVILLGAPVYGDGDLMPVTSDMFSMPIPRSWQTADQPSIGGAPLSGLRRYAEGRVVVSIGEADGLGWCDPDCRRLTGLTSINALESAIRGDRVLEPAEPTTLGGEPALAFGTNDPVERRYVVAMHNDRPVAVLIAGDWDVSSGITDEMIAGFAFIDPKPLPVDHVFKTADGRVELALSDAWKQSATHDELFTMTEQDTMTEQQMTVVAGDGKGRIVTCSIPRGPWELCRVVTATTLDQLVAAVQPVPMADHGVGPPSPRVDTGTLGGEPSVVTRIQAYEYPARSGQEVAYIAVMHDGRPYLVRLWTTRNSLSDLDSVIAGFRFVD